MKLKGIFVVTLVCLAVFSRGAAWGSADWMDDFEAAKAKAKAENRFMLLDFTGSDWCGWCIKLDKEVFSKNEFKTYASENLVLVMLDFPRRSKISSNIEKQNRELQGKFQVSGFPTVIVLDPNGNQIGKTGYKDGGPEKYVEHLKEIIEPHASKFGGVSTSAGGSGQTASASGIRTWTAASGSTVEATYYRMIGGTVELRKENGRTLRIALASLSESDHEFLRNIKAIQ